MKTTSAGQCGGQVRAGLRLALRWRNRSRSSGARFVWRRTPVGACLPPIPKEACRRAFGTSLDCTSPESQKSFVCIHSFNQGGERLAFSDERRQPSRAVTVAVFSPSTSQASFSPPPAYPLSNPLVCSDANSHVPALPQKGGCAGVRGQRQSGVKHSKQQSTLARRCPPPRPKQHDANPLKTCAASPLPPAARPSPTAPRSTPAPHHASRSGQHRHPPPAPEPDAGVGRTVVRGPRLRPLGPVVCTAVVGLAPGVWRRDGGRQQGGGALGHSRRRHRRRREAGQRGRVQGSGATGKVSFASSSFFNHWLRIRWTKDMTSIVAGVARYVCVCVWLETSGCRE